MQLYMPTAVYSEENCVRSHSRELTALGSKAMIVTGKHSAKRCGALKDVTDVLIGSGTEFILFDRVEENPSVETVMEARVAALDAGVDFFIGIGGGSPMDAAKAISLMTAAPNEDESILYTPAVRKHYPVACVPTTCGTGSEVTPYAILTRHSQRTKKSISHRIYPALALLDAKYLKTMSRDALVNTCVDALAHLLESYLNTNANELNRIYSREGLLLWSGFKDALLLGTPDDRDLRAMLHASMVAGMAITHTGTSLPHGLSYPVTYELGMPHGKAVGIFLGGFVDSFPDRRQAQEAAALLGFESTGALRDYLKELLKAGEVPRKLIESSALRLMEDPGKLKNYPFPVTAAEMAAMCDF